MEPDTEHGALRTRNCQGVFIPRRFVWKIIMNSLKRMYYN